MSVKWSEMKQFRHFICARVNQQRDNTRWVIRSSISHRVGHHLTLMCKKAFNVSNPGSVVGKGLRLTSSPLEVKIKVKIWKLEWSPPISNFRSPDHLDVAFVDPRCQFEINQIVSTKRCLKADSQRISSRRDSNKLFSPLNSRPLENRVQIFFHQRTPFWPSSIIPRHVCIYRVFCLTIYALVCLLSRPGYWPSFFFFVNETTPRSECQISHRDNAVTSLVPVNLVRTTSAIT